MIRNCKRNDWFIECLKMCFYSKAISDGWRSIKRKRLKKWFASNEISLRCTDMLIARLKKWASESAWVLFELQQIIFTLKSVHESTEFESMHFKQELSVPFESIHFQFDLIFLFMHTKIMTLCMYVCVSVRV